MFVLPEHCHLQSSVLTLLKLAALTKIFHQGYADVREGKFSGNFSDCFYKPCLQKTNHVAISWLEGDLISLPLRNFITLMPYSSNLIRTFGLLYL